MLVARAAAAKASGRSPQARRYEGTSLIFPRPEEEPTLESRTNSAHFAWSAGDSQCVGLEFSPFSLLGAFPQCRNQFAQARRGHGSWHWAARIMGCYFLLYKFP